MEIHLLDYVQLSENEMAAANRAESLEECQAHLDRAVGYAQLACRERQWQRSWNLAERRSGRRQDR
jgi:hypothetical protein